MLMVIDSFCGEVFVTVCSRPFSAVVFFMPWCVRATAITDTAVVAAIEPPVRADVSVGVGVVPRG